MGMFEVMCRVKCVCLVVNLLNHSFFWFGFKCFSTALHTKLNLSHPLVLGVSHYICNQPLDPMGIHFFATLMVGRGRPHMMLYEMLLWSLWKMHDFTFHKSKPMSFCPFPCSLHAITLACVLSINGVPMLVNIVLTALIQIDLVSWRVISHWVVMIIMAQAKDSFYHNQFLVNMFILLIIKVSSVYTNKQMNFSSCANMAWGVKHIRGPPLSNLHAFL